MSFNKISLFSLLLLTNCSFIMTMDQASAIATTQQSIQQKLNLLDNNIITISKQCQLAEKQKNIDKLAYDNYYTTWERERVFNTSFFKALIGEGPKFDYNAPEVRNYKGDFITYVTPPLCCNNGSEGEYNKLLKILLTKKAAYSRCKKDFKRGIRCQNLEFLQLIEKDLQHYVDLQRINEQ
jgi:hypothetical protein